MMKYRYKKLLYPALALFLMVSCSQGSSDVEKLRNEKQELKTLILSKKERIDEINMLLNEIDSSFRKEHERRTYVTTWPVEKKPFSHAVKASGTVKSKGNINVTTEMSGKIKMINVQEGDRVKKGQILVALDRTLITANIQEAQKQYELAKIMYDKRDRLWQQKIGREIDYLTAKNNKENIEKRISTLKKQRDQSIVKAPMSGIIDNIYAKIGEFAMVGQPLINMVNDKGMYIEVALSEKYLGKLKKNTAVRAEFLNIDNPFDTKIKSIGQVINPDNRTFLIETEVPKFSTPYAPVVNMTCVVSFVDYQNPSAISIPTRVIYESKKGRYIYVKVKKGKDYFVAKKIKIEIGNSFDGKTEIVKGLQEGHEVIIEGADKMIEGLRIETSTREM